MPRLVKKHRLWRRMLLLLTTLLVLFLVAGCIRAIHMRGGHWFDGSLRWVYFSGGCLATVFFLLLMYQLWRHRWWQGLTQQFLFLHRFNHELAHAVAALVTGAGVYSFNASCYGGAVQVGHATQPSFPVAIAPYVFSIFIVVLVLFAFFNPVVNPIFWTLLGAAYSYHVLGTAACMSPRQFDFQTFPYPVCIAWIVGVFVLTTGLIAALVAGGQQAAVALSLETARQTAHILHTGLTSLVHLLRSI